MNAERKQKTVGPWIHFGIVCVLLGGTAIGWPMAAEAMGWALHKEPVPWPEAVEVDEEEFRLTSLPEAFGPYMMPADGELRRAVDGSPELDGIPDGEDIISEEIRTELGVGTFSDQQRVSNRGSNWYVSRFYLDTRKKPGEPYRLWRLMITYYTGQLDKVPHVPERCLAVGGAQLIGGRETVSIDVPGAPGPWGDDVPFQRTRYEVSDEQGMRTAQYAQYYIFSFNGEPEGAWEMVRLQLNYPWHKYSYFAKIQFGPVGSQVRDIAAADAAARDFVKYFLPGALKMLPMKADVEALYAQDSEN